MSAFDSLFILYWINIIMRTKAKWIVKRNFEHWRFQPGIMYFEQRLVLNWVAFRKSKLHFSLNPYSRRNTLQSMLTATCTYGLLLRAQQSESAYYSRYVQRLYSVANCLPYVSFPCLTRHENEIPRCCTITRVSYRCHVAHFSSNAFLTKATEGLLKTSF